MPLRFVESLSYAEMSECCAARMADVVRQNPAAAMILATGHSPQLSYRRFVEKVQAEQIDTSRLNIIKLDEWVGPEKDDPSTCEAFLIQEILRPLDITENRYLSFDPACPDPDDECARTAAMLRAQKGADLAIVGIGRNGHVGLNEPNEVLSVDAHVAALAPQTREHAMLANARREITLGMTLGFGELFMANEILLLATGAGKAPVVRYLREGKVNTQIPASLLHLHRNATCCVDRSIG